MEMAILCKWNSFFPFQPKSGVPPKWRPVVSENFRVIRAYNSHFNPEKKNWPNAGAARNAKRNSRCIVGKRISLNQPCACH